MPRPTPASSPGPVDAVLTGDWAGPVRRCAVTVAVMYGLALVAVLVLGAAGGGPHLTLCLAAATVCAALGGTVFVRAPFDRAPADLTGELDLHPLTITLAGLVVLCLLFVRATRRRDLRECLLQAARTTITMGGFTLALALLSRVRAELPSGWTAGGETATVTVGASVASSVVAAVLLTVAALAVAVGLDGRALPGRLGRRVPVFRLPLLAALAVFGVWLVAAGGALLAVLIVRPEQLSTVTAALFVLPNLAVAGTLAAAGAPIGTTGWDGPGGTVSVAAFAEANPLWWLTPLLLVAALVGVAVLLVVRQETVAAARVEGLRLAAMFALVAAVGAAFAAAGGGPIAAPTLSVDPVTAAVLGALWGVVAAVVAPRVAVRVPPRVVAAVRSRWGAVPAPPDTA